MRTLIVEDEPAAAKRLEKLLEQEVPEAEIEGVLDSVADTVDRLRQAPAPDLVLLDIELSDGLSFDVFDRVEAADLPVIFTTGYDHYTLQAFKLNSIDYLLKPIDREELRRAIDKWKRRLREQPGSGLDPAFLEQLRQQLQPQQAPAAYKARFLSRIGDKMVSIPVEKALYFYSEDRTTYLYVGPKERHIVDYTLDQLEKVLDPKTWFRATRKLLVRIDTVKAAHHSFHGKLRLDLVPPPPMEEVYVSREKAGPFREWLEGG